MNDHEQRRADKAERARKNKDADVVQRADYGDASMKVPYGKPGYIFSMRQASKNAKGGHAGIAERRYWVIFKLDDNFQPVWINGVKPTVGTMERARAIDWSKQ